MLIKEHKVPIHFVANDFKNYLSGFSCEIAVFENREDFLSKKKDTE